MLIIPCSIHIIRNSYTYYRNQSDFGYGSNLHTQLTKLGQNQIINGDF